MSTKVTPLDLHSGRRTADVPPETRDVIEAQHAGGPGAARRAAFDGGEPPLPAASSSDERPGSARIPVEHIVGWPRPRPER